MNCQACCENLSALLDAELSRDEAAAVRGHIDACRGCSEELRGLEAASALIESGTRSLEPAPGLWSSVQARIAPPSGSRPGFFEAFRAFRWLPAAAAIAVVLTIGAGIRGYVAFQEAARREQEARSLERYMDDYVSWRRSEERAHRSAFAPPARTAAAPRAAPPARLQRVAHREHSDNPFVVADDYAAGSPFRADETAPVVEAAR